MATPWSLHWAGSTDVGRVRRMNEDSVLLTGPAIAVADGMGGHVAGEVASRVALDGFRRALIDLDGAPQLVQILAAVRKANTAVLDESYRVPELRGMGTTLCILSPVRSTDGVDRLAIVNVGDSRAYAFVDGVLRQISRDHSYVEDLVEAGEITAEQARVHPQRNIVTRALGIEADIQADAWELDAVVGHRYLLCSDGLTNEVSDEIIARVLATNDDPTDAARLLVALANDNGGHDNISVIVADVVGTAAASASVPAAAVEITDVAGAGAMAVGGWLAPDAGQIITESPSAASGPVQAGGEGQATATGARAKRPRRRRLTWLVGLFLVLVVGVLGVAMAAVGVSARKGYCIRFDGNTIVLIQGKTVLFFSPTIEHRYPEYTRQSFVGTDLETLDRGQCGFGSAAEAEASLAARFESSQAILNPPTTTTSTTTTTIAPPTTAPATTTTAAPTPAASGPPVPTTSPTG